MGAEKAIAELLERSGLSKSELSARSGVSRSLLDDYLKGRRQPSVAQVARLGEAAGLRLDLVWTAPLQVETPQWARPNPLMEAPPLTIEERAEVLERVVATATAMRRRPRSGEDGLPALSDLGNGRESVMMEQIVLSRAVEV
ncbi:MAG: helix-turn-helix transcriptional regulator [Aeromicrobium sp.]|uniref:helix-turn-helix domain-containing protein n=1 Tax=Aeromicrobium sp. TaxID=1871063 RepID=UPI0039E26C96